MISAIEQEIALRLPGSREILSLKTLEGSARVEESDRGGNSRRVFLPADRKVPMEVRYDAGPSERTGEHANN